jgi:hypothetical protein
MTRKHDNTQVDREDKEILKSNGGKRNSSTTLYCHLSSYNIVIKFLLFYAIVSSLSSKKDPDPAGPRRVSNPLGTSGIRIIKRLILV